MWQQPCSRSSSRCATCCSWPATRSLLLPCPRAPHSLPTPSLEYIKEAVAEADPVTGFAGLIKQRRRWLNGTFFAMIYTLSNWQRIWTESHHRCTAVLRWVEALAGGLPAGTAALHAPAAHPLHAGAMLHTHLLLHPAVTNTPPLPLLPTAASCASACCPWSLCTS